MRFHRSRTKMPLAGQTQVPNSIWACNRHDQAFRGLVSLLLLIPSMRTIGSVVDGGRRRRCRVCRGRLRPSDVGRVAAQSCCTFGTLTLKCQRLGRSLISCLQSTPGLSVTVADLVIRTSVHRSQTGSVGFRCGQPWWSASDRRRWQANHLISRDLRSLPAPAHMPGNLGQCCSAMRNDRHRFAALYGQNQASIARWPSRPGRPTTVKQQLTPGAG
jgi:hypothetical protein